MSATDHMRAMLAELMGSAAGDTGLANVQRTKFDDPRVCRNFLLNCCPHDILATTVRRTTHFLRNELTDCVKIHELSLRADFERAQQEKDYFYDVEAYDIINRFLNDTDRKMEIAKKKMEDSQEELSPEAHEKADRVLAINENLGKLLAEAERLGEEGMVEESVKLMRTVEELKMRKAEAESEYRHLVPSSAVQQQKLRACNDCGAYLGIHDNDRRLADHFGGKLHLGFVFLRNKRDELAVTVEERREKKRAEMASAGSGGGGARAADAGANERPASSERRTSRSGESRDRDRERDRDRDARRSRHRDDRDRDRDRVRDRDRDRDRSDRGDRDRVRDRDRDRDRHRDSRDRRDRHRDRDERKRKRSRSRSRSRSRDRKSSRSKRSRSRDRKRSTSRGADAGNGVDAKTADAVGEQNGGNGERATSKSPSNEKPAGEAAAATDEATAAQ